MPFLLITHRGPGHQKTGLFSFFDALTPPPKMLGGGGGGGLEKGLAKKVAKLVGEEVRPPQRLDV